MNQQHVVRAVVRPADQPAHASDGHHRATVTANTVHPLSSSGHIIPLLHRSPPWPTAVICSTLPPS
ncbi:transporter [Sesbania bispinosa]|nr:transporter [Sesbania bispinosa]